MVTSHNSSKAPMPRSPDMTTDSGLDSPPSYDYALSLPLDDQYTLPSGATPSGGSSSHPAPGLYGAATGPGGNETRGAPKHIEHLFNGPPNAEHLLGHSATPLSRVADIKTHTKWGRNVTFDPALQDPDTLFDFIRYQALQVPTVKFKIRGTHLEHHQRNEAVPDGQGGTNQNRKNETERVVDFDFWMDLGPVLDHPDNIANIHLRALDASQVTSRGTFVTHYGAQYRAPEASPFPALQPGASGDQARYTPLLPTGEYSATDVGARAGKRERGFSHQERAKFLWAKGLPGWIDVSKIPEFWAERSSGHKGKRAAPRAAIALPDSPTGQPMGGDEEAETSGGEPERWKSEQALRAWCVKYCQDPGFLKSWEINKWIWGWEIAALETAVGGAVLSTGYQSNDITVEVEMRDWNVVTPWYLMPIVLLLYPLIWLWQRAYPAGGAPYSLARASYAFKFYPPLPSTFPNETVDAAQDRLPSLYKLHPELPKSPVLQRGPKGVHYLLGRKEGEWFREWEERIRMGVRMRYQGELQDTRVGEHEAPMLDGY